MIGCSVVVKDLSSDKTTFLNGHSFPISCLSVSSDGAKLASGEETRVGVQVSTFINDVESLLSYHNYPLKPLLIFHYNRLISLCGTLRGQLIIVWMELWPQRIAKFIK